jgi:hypothetical protein
MTTMPTMTRIDAARDGTVPAGRSQAQALREEIERAAIDGDVVVDFARVLTLSPSFADELFAKLSPELVESGRVEFQNLSPATRAIADFVISGRHGTVAT